MKNLLLLFAAFLFVGVLQSVKAQNISNEGTEFWSVFPTHVPNQGSPATMNVNVTSKFNTEVTVSCGTTSETKAVPANQVVTFLVDRPQSYIESFDRNRNLVNRGIHIQVTTGMPKIVAYSHVFAAARSAATLILPVDALGQEYYSMNYIQDQTGDNFLAVVATENNTDLILHKTDGTSVQINGLNKGDVYEYLLPSTDLTGTYVTTAPNSSCKKFAAFSGSSALRIGGNSGGIDPLLQQLYAVDSWGKTYGVVPFINRRYIVRALAQEDNTVISFDGIPVGTVSKGQYIEQVLVQPTIVSSDKLISVAQYSYTQEYSSPSGTGLSTGDPEMVLLNPVEFNIKNITLFSSDKRSIIEKYLNVFMKTNKTGSFKINGFAPNNGTWLPISSDPTYSYIQVAVDEESLTLTADDGFNAIAYGFGDHESYAYSAGTNLASSLFLLLYNKTTKVENAAACVGQASDFRLTLPYELESIVWTFSDGTPDYVDLAPVAVLSTNASGTTLYSYAAPVNKIFNILGPTQVTANAVLSAAAGDCFTKEVELIFNFNVDPLPTAALQAPAVGCMDSEVQFTDKSLSNVADKSITGWQWDFGDGTPLVTEQNPKHKFATAGGHIVKLVAVADNGCFSDVVTHEIFINPKPNATFSISPVTCAGNQIVFTDLSDVASGSIVKWNWDFGDTGATSNTSTVQSPTHSYVRPGIYTVTLVVETDKGCSNTFSVAVTVNDVPKIGFAIPAVCIRDAQAVFVNNSTDFDGSQLGLVYSWDFGDPTSGTANNSTERDGKHKYNATGYYDVKLTVTNKNGCTVSTSLIPFVVNGANPRANFDILNENKLCSNTQIALRNTSTVDFGRITKLRWLLDGLPYGDDDLNTTTGKIYNFTVPEFTSPLTKTIKVKMIVFSGEGCVNEIEKDLILLASPQVQFATLTSVCLNQPAFQLMATENGGLTGQGVYNGKGVSLAGLFNPSAAGVGSHDITFTFTASNGCLAEQSRTIQVLPIPVVDAGSDIYILVGGEKQITARATGTGLTYEWTPAIGLSRTDVLNPIASPEADTKYTLKVTSNEGCITYDEVDVKVLQTVEAPNTFSPNGDGINDLWNIKYLETYPKGTVEIYNRNGQRVYLSSRGYANPFDGNFNNKPLPVGTYYYIINPNTGRRNITGNLTIIR